MARPRKSGNKDLPPNLYRNGAYWIFEHPKTKQRTSLGKDAAAAKAAARAFNAEWNADLHSRLQQKIQQAGVSTAASKIPTFAEFLFQSNGAYERWKRFSKHPPKEQTERVVTGMFKRFERECEFKDLRLNQITRLDVDGYLNAAEAQTPASIAMVRSRLSLVFEKAITAGYIETNPVNGTEKRYAPNAQRMRMTLPMWQSMFDYANERPEYRPLASALLLMILTAQRIEVISQMEFSHEKNGEFLITSNKARGGNDPVRLALPVSLKLDDVPYTLAEAIKRCRLTLVASRYCVHQLRSHQKVKKGDPMRPQGIEKMLADVRDALGIVPPPDSALTPPTAHEVRSLSARLYYRQFGFEFVHRLLGHKDEETTRRYLDERDQKQITFEPLDPTKLQSALR